MSKDLKGCFFHNRDDWRTPSYIYKWFVEECGYFDPCPSNPSFDGLEIKWPTNVFCNPPYSQISKWVDKCIKEHLDDPLSDIVLLVPVRTDTQWFSKLSDHISTIVFIRGRLKFDDGKLSAPFPSMLVSLHHSTNRIYCYVSDLYYMKRNEVKNE